jgi:hypothetical protein
MSKEIQLKITCDNIMNAFDKCNLELIKQMAKPNTQLEDCSEIF